MKKIHKSKSRRQFMKDAVRTIVLGSLAFAGLSLGSRRASHSGDESSCVVDLPCRICSKLPGCPQSEARDVRQEYRESRNLSIAKDRGPE